MSVLLCVVESSCIDEVAGVTRALRHLLEQRTKQIFVVGENEVRTADSEKGGKQPVGLRIVFLLFPRQAEFLGGDLGLSAVMMADFQRSAYQFCAEQARWRPQRL